MKTSQLINELRVALERHGDVDVTVYENNSSPVTVKTTVVSKGVYTDGHNQVFPYSVRVVLLP
jgi:hypothetical protein